MKIRDKMLTIIGIPLFSILLIFVIGLVSFYRINETIEAMSLLQSDRSTMIDADRDAYQAFVSIKDAYNIRTLDELAAFKSDFDENAEQTWERITEPGKRFDETMARDFDEFKANYTNWKNISTSLFDLGKVTVSELGRRDLLAKDSIELFETMRNVTDELTGLIESELEKDLSDKRRLEMEKAQSLVLNGDRDSYQAYLAQYEILNVVNKDILTNLDNVSNENINQTLDRVNEAANILGGTEAGKLISDFNRFFSSWKDTTRAIVDITRNNFENIDNARELQMKMVESFDMMRADINKLGELQVARVDKYYSVMMGIIFSVKLLYSIIFGVAVVLSSVIAIIIARKIITSLHTSINVTETISKGDLTVENDVYEDDEIGDLANSLRSMVTNLHKVVNDVVRGSHQIASASSQLAEGNQDLSSRTEAQAAALQQISSAIEEMNSAIRANADNTTTANRLSLDVSEKAEEGTASVNQMITSMNEISDSSKKIADIIEVINKIAFQTNLLALNASIEAARAGEHGKGFAVVAVEVRKLAKRSDDAAAEIAEIIKTSNSKVDEGVTIANTAGNMLLEINEAVKKVTVLVGEISASSQEQLSSVDEIDKTVSALDVNTQKNAALAEEAASATEELSGQADELNDSMRYFKLKKTESSGGVKYLGEMKPRESKPKKKDDSKGSYSVKESNPVNDEEDDFDQLLTDEDFKEFE